MGATGLFSLTSQASSHSRRCTCRAARVLSWCYPAGSSLPPTPTTVLWYSLYLLYWHKSTNTDAAYTSHPQPEPADSSASPPNRRLLSVASSHKQEVHTLSKTQITLAAGGAAAAEVLHAHAAGGVKYGQLAEAAQLPVEHLVARARRHVHVSEHLQVC